MPSHNPASEDGAVLGPPEQRRTTRATPRSLPGMLGHSAPSWTAYFFSALRYLSGEHPSAGSDVLYRGPDQ